MKYKWLVLLVGLFPGIAYGAALNFTPTITLTAVSPDSMRIQFTARATGLDTIKVRSAGADSATTQWWFKAAATKDTTVGSRIPMKQYIWLVRCDSSGVYKYSVADTASTYPPQIEQLIQPSITDDFRQAFDKYAWSRTQQYDGTFNIADTGADSSMVYENWPYNGVTLNLSSGATDSTKVKVRVWAGRSTNATAVYHPTPSSIVWNYAVADSLNITAKGTYTKTWSIPAGAKYWYMTFEGQTGNAHATTGTAYIRRAR